jgi:adenylate cyclase
VVLPFANLSGDASEDYLGDVLTEELTTSLARLPDSFVVSRTTAFAYRGRAEDVKAIGKELGVRYVLEGSAQKSGSRIRVNAQLIDAETGAHLWADQFDANQGELLEMQDEIVIRLARALQIQPTAVEASRVARAHAENADAEELAMECEAGYLRSGAQRAAQVTYTLCDRARNGPPQYSRARDLGNSIAGARHKFRKRRSKIRTSAGRRSDRPGPCG